jgi:hypothetical protein
MLRASRIACASKRGFATVVDASAGFKVAAVDNGQPSSSVTVLLKAGSRYQSKPGVAHALSNFAFKVSVPSPLMNNQWLCRVSQCSSRYALATVMRAKSDVCDFGVRTWVDVMPFSLPRACYAQWTSQAAWEVFFQQIFEFCMPSHSLPRLAEAVPSNWTLTFVFP